MKPSFIVHAEYELRRAGVDERIRRAVMKLLKKLSKQGQLGCCTHCILDIFYKLSRSKPLTPLTGEDEEWIKVKENLLRNRRCQTVFRTPATGETWDMDFREGKEPITFPYTPGAEEHIQ